MRLIRNIFEVLNNCILVLVVERIRYVVNNEDGLTEGAGSNVGKPPATVLLMSGEFTQPAVIELKDEVVVEYDVVQLCTRPGILPAAAVTWKEEIVSNAIP